MNYFKYPLLMLFSLSMASATVYESGDSGVDNWIVYDNKPAGAMIENIFDQERNSKVISVQGEGRKNAYQLGARKGVKSWNNQNEKVLKFSMKIDEKYKLYIYAQTEKGYRYFYYSHSRRDKGLIKGRRTSYIHHSLGKASMDGKWHNYVRDLEADLKEYEPDNKIIAINGFRLKGSALIDDIELTGKVIENPLVAKAKKYCENGDNSTKKVMCSLENNRVYLIEREEYDDVIHIISTENQWSVLGKQIIGYNGYQHSISLHKLKDTSLFYLESQTSRTSFFDFYYLHENKLKEVLSESITTDTFDIDNLKTIANGKRLLIEYHHEMTPNDKIRREYDIAQLPKVTKL